jgi:ribosomal protein S18 acetylase RimI-like enzyme
VIEIVRVTDEIVARYGILLEALGGEAGAAMGLEQEGVWVLAAEVDGQPAGIAVAVRVPKLDGRRGFLFVDELVVLPEQRRRGVGQALLGRVEAVARELGLAGVRLLARAENEAARRLYARQGYTESESVFCEKKF